MGRYLLGKLTASLVLVVAITLFAFVAFYVLPTSTSVGRHGVVDPNPVHGSLVRAYGHYFWRFVAHGDLGTSTFTREDVTRMLWEGAPVTLSLVAGGLVVSLLIALPLGLVSALRPRSLIDRAAGLLVLVGLSVFPLWLALILSYFFGYRWHMLPIQGYCSMNSLSTGCDGLGEWAYHLLLPWLTYGVVNAALFASMTRALVVEQLQEEYLRTARAKGAGEARIVRAHLFKNVALPLVTMLGVNAGTALTGVIFIESAFGLPGLGGILRQAAVRRDLPVTAGTIVLLGLVIMVLNLVVDIAYVALEPRLRSPRPRAA
jgi:peptide/nickel transport system permease protein